MAEWEIPEDPEAATFSLIIEVMTGEEEDYSYSARTIPLIGLEIESATCDQVLRTGGEGREPRIGTYVVTADQHGVHFVAGPEGITEEERRDLCQVLGAELMRYRRQLVGIAQRLQPEAVKGIAEEVIRAVVEQARRDDPLHESLRIPDSEHIQLEAVCKAHGFLVQKVHSVAPGMVAIGKMESPHTRRYADVRIMATPREPIGPVVVKIGMLSHASPLFQVVHTHLLERVLEAVDRDYGGVLTQIAVETEVEIQRASRLMETLQDTAGFSEDQIRNGAADVRDAEQEREQERRADEAVKLGQALAGLGQTSFVRANTAHPPEVPEA